MNVKKRKVICIDSSNLFIKSQVEKLKMMDIHHYYYPFTNLKEAVYFIEEEIIKAGIKVHYILLDEALIRENYSYSLNKLSEIFKMYKKPETIVCANKNENSKRKEIMRHSLVSAYINKPLPENYIKFLITGKN